MKKQFKLYIDAELIENLEMLARKYGKKSANSVAQEILQEFAEFWVHLQELNIKEKSRLKATIAEGAIELNGSLPKP